MLNRFSLKHTARWLACCIALGCTPIAEAEPMANAPVTIMTNTWAPYINNADADSGTAAAIVKLLATELNTGIKWQYVPYDLSFQMVKRNRAELAFPFFKTEARAREVAYSNPIFSVTSHLYYNLQYLSSEQSSAALETLRIGRVSGYSYGQSIDALLDQAVVYSSESAALQALFNNQIDLLPMTDSVMAHTLRTDFPERIQLIRQRPGITDQSALHMIAPPTAQGRAAIAEFNRALANLRQLNIDSLKLEPTLLPKSLDLAQLATAEGYPAILGQTHKNANTSQFFTLPQGTRVIVIQWSERILNPSPTDRIYKNMMDLSRVLVLNGPHVGKELFIRNMHIELL